jgi:O-antigen/teichoic acid export membrane protein
MSPRNLIRRFRRSELRGLATDTTYVAVWQGAIAVADLVQISLVTHALGLGEYGRLALVSAFVALVGGFFNVRIGIAATIHGAPPLAEGEPRRAASVFRLAYMIDFGTAAVALLVLAVLAPIVGPGLVGEGAVALVMVSSLTIVAQALDTTSVSVLRLLNRFRLVAVNRVICELGRVVLLVAVLSVSHDLLLVAAAVSLSKVAVGAANLVAASRVFRSVGNGWRLRDRAGPLPRPERRTMLGTVFHTNLVAYAKVAETQVPTLVLGWIAGTTETGIYKVGMAVAGGITRLTAPASAALLPRLTKLWAAGRRAQLVRLVRHATLISLPAIVVTSALMLVFRDPLLHLLGGEHAAAEAGTVFVFALIGNAFQAAVFWRTALLYAVGRANLMSAVTLPATAFQIAAVVLLAPEYGAEGAAAAFVVGVGLNSLALSIAAVRAVRTEEPPRAPAMAGTAAQ